jgi:hypothetical protein
MAVTALLYGAFIDRLAQKGIDLDSDSIKVALATNAYTPNQDTHDFFNDITNEVTGTGYTAGGQALASVTWAYTAGTNTWTFDAADTVWTSSTLTARYAIIYDSTPGTAATNPLIGYVDFGADVSSTAASFTITWNASGIFTVTVA